VDRHGPLKYPLLYNYYMLNIDHNIQTLHSVQRTTLMTFRHSIGKLVILMSWDKPNNFPQFDQNLNFPLKL